MGACRTRGGHCKCKMVRCNGRPLPCTSNGKRGARKRGKRAGRKGGSRAPPASQTAALALLTAMTYVIIPLCHWSPSRIAATTRQ